MTPGFGNEVGGLVLLLRGLPTAIHKILLCVFNFLCGSLIFCDVVS